MSCCNAVFILFFSIAEITNFTKELRDITAKMVDSIRKAGDTVSFFLFSLVHDLKTKQRDTCRYYGPIYLAPEHKPQNIFNFQFQTDVLLPTKNEVHSLFGKRGLFNRYDKYR